MSSDSGTRGGLAEAWKMPVEWVPGWDDASRPDKRECTAVMMPTCDPVMGTWSYVAVRSEPAAAYTRGWPPKRKTKNAAQLPVLPLGLDDVEVTATGMKPVCVEGVSDYVVARLSAGWF